MAENRKSATQAAARKAARERAAERAAESRRRQDQLEELAASYFVAVDAVEGIEADAEERIAAIRAETERKVAASRAEAAGIVGRMLDTKVSRDEVAARLGIPLKDVKRVKRAADADAQPTQAGTTGEQRNDSQSGDVDEHADIHYDEHAAA
ncbi:hypothetical protein KZI27_00940 (plasmid) [Curtobacterium sp. TC1]|uniref:hypothetical protein n=1 Tax=Curtobacterium sp. TC1 TaxID=2862880 RepID=UPI001C9AB3E1|nr:hypothetical protein [Curtobacterium sp. TC1]QZQ53790.1 hypothetical protein KZI27_00940 [Curtobacterium sp. TC1]